MGANEKGVSATGTPHPLFRCLAAALYQSQPLSAARPGYPGGVCVVIGSEGQGLTEETIAACSGTVRIPMTDRVESLNAGIAGSILLWHFREESL